MTINCRGTLIDLSQPKIMGILNTTPDSFYDGGRYKDKDAILAQVAKMLAEGATFIDVGAYSSRPGADFVSEKEELKRILPIVDLLLTKFPEIIISVDTFRSNVANACLQAGAAMINDISAGHMDNNMMHVVAEHQAPYIAMHMRGTAKTMQGQTDYEHLLEELVLYFSERLSKAKALGIKDILIDPGFGFAKTLDQNYEILQNLSLFKFLEAPILVGLSRKSMIYKLLDTTAQEALNGTTALHMFSLNNGANILRAHDVKEAQECCKLMLKLDSKTDG